MPAAPVQTHKGTAAALAAVVIPLGDEVTCIDVAEKRIPDGSTAYGALSRLATMADVTAAVVGLWDPRGNYDASGNVFPSTGGSGTAGAILKGDLWMISVAGTLGGTAAVAGDLVWAKVDAPGSTAGNWALISREIGFTPMKRILGTATKTASYAAGADELVPLDTTSATPIVVTLPTAPPDGTIVEAGWIAGGNATATAVTGGGDTFQGGGTTSTLQYLYQFRRYLYRTAGALWTVQNSMPISALDARYQALSPTQVAGRTYFFPAGFPGAVAQVNGQHYATPFCVKRTVTLDRIGTEVTVIGDVGSKVRLGIYADDGTFRPGALVLDAGQIAGDSATVQQITISQQLTPGWYWATRGVQSVVTTSPTCKTTTIFDEDTPSLEVTSPLSAGQQPHAFVTTGVTAALPNPFGTTGFTTSTNGTRLFGRVLSLP